MEQQTSSSTRRRLKIESHGDSWRGAAKSKIRLIGQWLKQAGFEPGQQVEVTCLAPGLIELRSATPLMLNEGPPAYHASQP